MEKSNYLSKFKLILVALLIVGLLAVFSVWILQKPAPQPIEASKNSIEIDDSITIDDSVEVSNTVLLNNQEQKNGNQDTLNRDISNDPPQSIEMRVAMQKVNLLKDILNSKNDNDPRLDSDFRELSELEHQVLIKEYANYPKESRNERGTIAFLITRDMKSTNDVNFLVDVLSERPCYSLKNCEDLPDKDPHHSGAEQTTLNYPQLAILFQLENKIKNKPELMTNAEFLYQINQILSAADKSPIEGIRNKSASIRKLLP